MKALVIFALLLMAFQGKSQSVVSSSGANYSTTQTNLDFTIGEAVVGSFENINQGFHQVTVLDDPLSINKDLNLDIIIYPNPTIDKLNVQSLATSKLTYQLFDLSGKRLNSGRLDEKNNSIDVSNLDEGVFKILFQELESDHAKSFLLIKRN
ncbi:T9SS type A sorting domain-containing protein [Ekhidna sp.]